MDKIGSNATLRTKGGNTILSYPEIDECYLYNINTILPQVVQNVDYVSDVSKHYEYLLVR